MKYCLLLLSMECSLTRGLTKDKFGSWNMNNVTEDQDVFEGGVHGSIFSNWKHYQAEGSPILELSVPHLVRFLLVSNLTEPIQVNDFLLNSCLNHCDNFLWMLLWRLNNHKRKWDNHLVSVGGTSVIRVLEGSSVVTWEAPVEYESGQCQPGEPQTPPPPQIWECSLWKQNFRRVVRASCVPCQVHHINTIPDVTARLPSGSFPSWKCA